MLFTHKRIFFTVCLAVTIQLGAHNTAWCRDVFPMRQGIHEWPVVGGKVIAVVGTYRDTMTFRRIYSFYFKAKDLGEWNQVPLLRSTDDVDFTAESAGTGDNTIADGIVVAQGQNVYFVFADKCPDKGATKVTWYKFVAADDAHPDAPGYYFQPTFARTYPKNSIQTVDEVLFRESNLRPAK
jgi:hypothetical protein